MPRYICWFDMDSWASLCYLIFTLRHLPTIFPEILKSHNMTLEMSDQFNNNIPMGATKLLRDSMIFTPNLLVSNLHHTWQEDVFCLRNRGLGPWININVVSDQHNNLLCGDRTVVRLYFLCSRILHQNKNISIHWIRDMCNCEMWLYHIGIFVIISKEVAMDPNYQGKNSRHLVIFHNEWLAKWPILPPSKQWCAVTNYFYWQQKLPAYY